MEWKPTGNKNNNQQYRELPHLLEQMQREEWLLWYGEVVDEACNQGHCTRNHRSDSASTGPGMGRGAGPGQTDKEDSEATGVQHKANVIDLLDLLPSGLLKVVLRARWWPVEDQCSNHAENAIDNTDIVAPAPACFCVGV
jgi:hypothetical protein